jgi:hypothetical protein
MMLQLGISGDVYLQKLLRVLRARLTHMFEYPEHALRASGLHDPHFSGSDQLETLEDNYSTLAALSHAGLGEFNYYNSQPFAEQEPAVDGGMTRQGMNYNVISRETEWILTVTPVVVHSANRFHPCTSTIEGGMPLTQFTQHQCQSVGNLNPWFLDKGSSGQISTVFEAEGDRIAQETIELGIVALFQANGKPDLHPTVPMPSHFYDKTGTRRDSGQRDYSNI